MYVVVLGWYLPPSRYHVGVIRQECRTVPGSLHASGRGSSEFHLEISEMREVSGFAEAEVSVCTRPVPAPGLHGVGILGASQCSNGS